MVEEINKMLEEMGSKFGTVDGLVLAKYIGNLTFLTKKFTSIEECHSYVKERWLINRLEINE